MIQSCVPYPSPIPLAQPKADPAELTSTAAPRVRAAMGFMTDRRTT